MMKCWLVLILFCLTVNCQAEMQNENKALKRLKEGNQRFINNSFKALSSYHINRLSTIEGQNPFAIILACSDSRVAPEIIFDEGIGDLFVIRVAGNILGETEWETIKFGIEILGVDTIMVLGHEACGAVQATIDKIDLDIPIIAEQVTKGIAGQTDVNKAAEANVRYVVKQLQSRLKGKTTTTVGGFYHITTGEVEFLTL